MIWLGWYEMLLLSLLMACVCMGISALVTVTRKVDRSVLTGASVTLGLMGSVLALAASAPVMVGLAGGMWPAVFGYLGAMGGMVGIVGCLLARTHRRASGYMMLAAGLLTFITLAGPALLMTAGALAASRQLALTGKRAVVRVLRIVTSMAFPVLLMTTLYFSTGSALVYATLGVCGVYLAVMIIDYVWSLGSRRAQTADAPQL
jgi:hypothetical protein